MNLTAIEDAILGYCNSFVFADPSPIGAIIADSNAPRPNLDTFITVKILSLTDISSMPEHGDVNDEGNRTIYIHQDLTVSFQCYGDDSNSAIETLRNNLYLENARRDLEGRGLVFVQHLTTINNVASSINTEIEQRYSFDAQFRLLKTLQDAVGYIETVEGSATINDVSQPYSGVIDYVT